MSYYILKGSQMKLAAPLSGPFFQRRFTQIQIFTLLDLRAR